MHDGFLHGFLRGVPLPGIGFCSLLRIGGGLVWCAIHVVFQDNQFLLVCVDGQFSDFTAYHQMKARRVKSYGGTSAATSGHSSE